MNFGSTVKLMLPKHKDDSRVPRACGVQLSRQTKKASRCNRTAILHIGSIDETRLRRDRAACGLVH